MITNSLDLHLTVIWARDSKFGVDACIRRSSKKNGCARSHRRLLNFVVVALPMVVTDIRTSTVV